MTTSKRFAASEKGMTASTMKVAAAQLNCSVDTLDANVERHLELIARAKQAGVDLLVFPELSTTGFPQTAEQIDHLSCRLGHGYSRTLTEASEGITVVFGMVEEAPSAQFHNSAVVVRDREIIYRHRKLNLASYGALHEGKLFASGRYVETFELAGPWRAGILICADAWNPALVTLAALHGATILILPVNSAREAVGTEFSNPGGWDVAVRFYSMIYGMPVIMANRVGTEDGLTFWGGSRIIDPFGNEIACAEEDAEDLLTATIDYAVVRRARLQLPTVRDSNLALIHREVSRLQSRLGIPEHVRSA